MTSSGTTAKSEAKVIGGSDSHISKRAYDEVAAPSRTRSSGKATEFSIILVGASFKTSSLAFRERLAKKLVRDSEKLRHMAGVREYAELVTCNRIEIVIATEAPHVAERFFRSWFSGSTEGATFPLYLHKDTEAIAHLFRVASGLDSMVTGEEQILAQVKDAGIRARTTGSSRASLSALFDVSVNVGKRVRAAVKALDSAPSTDRSVSASAVQFALDRLPQSPRSVLLIGTGKTAR